MIERERKFSLDSNVLFSLRTLTELVGYKIIDRGTSQRHYIYYDTSDFDLFQKGITVGIRRREKDCVLCYKFPVGNSGVEVRREESFALSPYFKFAIGQDLSAEESVREYLSGFYDALGRNVRLVGRLNLDIINNRKPVVKDSNIVLELDLAKCLASKRHEMALFYEAEVEVEKKGSVRDLNHFCKKLVETFDLSRLNQNKYQRAVKKLRDVMR